MDKEHMMLQAQILKKQGYKQFQIASMLGVTDRTVRNYLRKEAAPPIKNTKGSKLEQYKQVIAGIINDNPYYNCILLHDRLKNQGYTGKISILRDYAATIRKKAITEAVIRFETEPGRQAQVDWKIFKQQKSNGKWITIYAFIMLLGFSRKPFIKFTRSMKQGVLHACHAEAFDYFGGVPHEILYDNMKTAFVCDGEGNWHANKRLLHFANHYGFVPKRCQIYRPQTKGKVERAIGYLDTNFWPRVKDLELEPEALNDQARKWADLICQNKLIDFNETRAFRFEKEKPYLLPIPAARYDYRDEYTLMVSRESLITFETNRYSVPPEYIGEFLTLKVDPIESKAEVLAGSASIREFRLEKPGSRAKIFIQADKTALLKLWEKQRDARLARVKKTKQSHDLEIRTPAIYDQYVNTNEVA
jgi:transposase